MFMLCFYYCFPLAKFLYFAIAPAFFIFALFMLKRGIRRNSAGLRQSAFAVMFAALIKLCMFDIRMLKKDLLCGRDADLSAMACNRFGFMMTELTGLIFLVGGSFVLFQFYRVYMHARRLPPVKPEDINLRSWANGIMTSVIFMTLWLLAPWVAYLTVGHLPAVFSLLPWQALATLNLVLLLVGFWKAESCVWDYDVHQKKQLAYMNKSWTPKDTLWTAVFIYLVTLALGYVAHDILT